MNIDEHLCGYDQVLDFFGFGDWHLVSQRELPGPNWKIAYDGYLDFYHLPFLHRDSFGPDMHNKAIYTTWGPHQRMTHPDPALLELRDVPEDEWNLDQICGGVWTIFPHISIAGGNGGGQVAQLFPGTTPGTSRTILNYYVAAEPSDEQRAQAHRAGRLRRARRARRGLRHRLRASNGRWPAGPSARSSSAATRAAASASTVRSTATSPETPPQPRHRCRPDGGPAPAGRAEASRRRGRARAHRASGGRLAARSRGFRPARADPPKKGGHSWTVRRLPEALCNCRRR